MLKYQFYVNQIMRMGERKWTQITFDSKSSVEESFRTHQQIYQPIDLVPISVIPPVTITRLCTSECPYFGGLTEGGEEVKCELVESWVSVDEEHPHCR